MWFFIALLGYFLLAVVVILDKFILTKSVPKPAVYTFYSTIFMFGALLALPFGGGLLAGADWWWAITSGVAFGIGLYAMYMAIKYGEASHIAPFVGAVVTVGSFFLGAHLLAESLSSLQIYGMIALIIASLLLSFEVTRKRVGFHRGYLWAIAAGLLFALSHVTAKYVYDIYPFITGLVWTRAATGLVGLALLALPSVRRSIHSSKRKKQKKKVSAATLVITDKVLGVIAVVLIQYAIALGEVTLVNAMSGLQFAFLFIMIVMLSKFAKRIFKEYFTKKEMLIQTFAILLVIVGSALFVL